MIKHVEENVCVMILHMFSSTSWEDSALAQVLNYVAMKFFTRVYTFGVCERIWKRVQMSVHIHAQVLTSGIHDEFTQLIWTGHAPTGRATVTIIRSSTIGYPLYHRSERTNVSDSQQRLWTLTHFVLGCLCFRSHTRTCTGW